MSRRSALVALFTTATLLTSPVLALACAFLAAGVALLTGGRHA